MWSEEHWAALPLPWQTSFTEAWAAYCAGSLPIGSVVTGSDGAILARGRNRILENQGEPGLFYGHTLAHAEMNALAAIPAQVELDRHTCTIYTTLEPCPMCMGAIYMSGVRQVRFACRDAFAGSTNLLGKTAYLSRKPVRVYGPETGLSEDLLMSVMVAFESQSSRRPDLLEILFDTWQVDTPRGVAFGRYLAQTDILRQLRQSGAAVSEVYTQLVEKLLTFVPSYAI